MFRIWMLLVVGAAAVRQVEEDAFAHSVVKEKLVGPLSFIRSKWQDWRTSRLRRAVKKVAKRFPEEEREHLTETVMKAYQNGELDKDKLRRSWDEKSLYLFATMKTEWNEKRLKRDVERVAKEFPEKERQNLSEAVMKAFKNGELNEGFRKMYGTKMSWESKQKYLVATMQGMRELPVAASAIKFCANLFREVNHFDTGVAEQKVHEESEKAAEICHKVLTGELGRGPKWAEEAAKSSQPYGHLELGRLQEVNATEKAWKVSLKNVCKDECHALVKEIRTETMEILGGVADTRKPPSYQEACAKHVVQKVEAEILGCCAEKCGWNGRACMLWPFLNSTEKGQWEAECCTEFNILKGSSRAIMCDATLTGKENEEVIRDGQPNSREDREMIGQDPVGRGTSFLQSEDTNGLTPSPEYKPIWAPEGTCPPPLDLGKIHEKLKHEWKTTVSQFSIWKFQKFPACMKPPPKNDTIGECTAFLPQSVDGPYVFYGECLESVPVKDLPKLDALDAKSTGNTGLLYVHETIFKR